MIAARPVNAPLCRAGCTAGLIQVFQNLTPPCDTTAVRQNRVPNAVRALPRVYSNLNMKCPFCRVDHDRVIDSRSSQDGLAIRRRRECVNCGRRFTTYERPEETTIKVIKKDGSRVPFEREKIKRGLERACWKRPISTRQIEATTAAIENEVYSLFDSEVESRELGELVMRYLRDLDAVAFVRFASVYRQFNDAYDFFEELRPMLDEGRKTPR